MAGLLLDGCSGLVIGEDVSTGTGRAGLLLAGSSLMGDISTGQDMVSGHIQDYRAW